MGPAPRGGVDRGTAEPRLPGKHPLPLGREGKGWVLPCPAALLLAQA